ncbi:MAG TPA: tetratricopeptide repeat protein [Methylomirabilota bacterium]|nr:tetratricopeptide repeat protein [Methylomirabilota bacterium]
MTRLERALPLVVGVLAFVAFLPALDGGFVDWDDDRNFLWNSGYRGLGPRELQWMFTATWMGHYIPLTWLSLGLNYAVGGMKPWGYHLGNLVIHAANATLFFFLARRLLAITLGNAQPESGEDRASRPGGVTVSLGAAAAALLWAVHPLRVESVAWVTERRDVLCGFFYLLAVFAYVRGVTQERTLSGPWLVASLAAFTAALGSKAMAMTLPATLLVLDIYPLRRLHLGWPALIREKLGHFALGAVGAVVASWAVTRGAGWTSYAVQGLEARLAMTGYSFWFYPWKLVWPENLSPLYELPARIHLLDARFLYPALVVVVATVLLVLGRRRLAGALAAWLQSIIVLAPVSGIAHAGHQLAHDRYSYLSSLGFAVLAGAGVTWLGRQRARGRVSRWVFASTLLAVVLALAGLGASTWVHVRIWHDSESLWRAAVAADPACALCRSKLGNVLLSAGLPREAEAELTRAIALRPERATAHNSLGSLLVQQGRLGEAEAEFREAIRLTPDYPEATANLGALHARQRRYPEAIVELRRAIALSAPLDSTQGNLAFALDSLGIELAREGKPAEAASLFTEATQLRPSEAAFWRNLGQALVEDGKIAEALPSLERAVALHPTGAAERFWLARAYLRADKPLDAQAQIGVLRSLDPAAAAGLSAPSSGTR